MSNTIGNTNDLNALGDLLGSLHTNDVPSSGTPLSTEQLHRLSEKINEILGDRSDHDPTPGDQPSQLLNEDGLPIIDISENVDEDPQMSASPSPVREQDLIPLSLSPPDEKERRRRERDRILDLLEEEERLQQLQEELDAEEERMVEIKRLKESTKAELDRLKATRELQKKMGQALIRHAERTVEDRQEEDARVTSSVAKKSVSFADAPTVETDERDLQKTDWGDVTPGRLRAPGCVPLVSSVEADKYPMKMCVVERRPVATSPSLNDADSDDESVSSAGSLSPRMENDSLDDKDLPSSGDDHLSDDEPLEEGLDFDVAQHHREIALEYHKKKHVIGAETAKAMARHNDDYEQHEASKEQLPLSRFRADRMTAAYDKSHSLISTSIGQTVLPASRQKSLQNSIRSGKLENDQLVGGPSGESGSEDETVREVVHMLGTGRIQNRGPDFDPPTIVSPQDTSAAGSPSTETSTAAHGAKPSRFKLARGGSARETTASQDNNGGDKPQSQPAISNVVERKTPGSACTRQRFPINKPSLRSPVIISERASPAIIESPSFPMTAPSTSTVTIPTTFPAHHKPTGSPSLPARSPPV